MSQLRNQLTAAKREYHDCRYQGSLAADIGLRGHGSSSHTHHRLRWLAALAAMAAVVVLLRHNNETIPTSTVPAPKIAVKTTPSPPVTIGTDSTDEASPTISSVPSLSFESVTDWPSVSADLPSLGGLPALEWNTQANQTPTTQESSS